MERLTMKKENRQLAKEKKAKQRKAEKRNKMLKKLAVIGVPVVAALAFIGLLIYSGISESKDKKKEDNTSTETYIQTTENTTFADSTEGATKYITTEGTVVELGDTVNIDYVGYKDGVPFDGGNTYGGGADLTLGSGQYIPGFEDGLVGHKVGENVSLNVTFPENYDNEELKGADVVFEVTINGVYK